jgi:3-methyladenine DNA glycosylase Tag
MTIQTQPVEDNAGVPATSREWDAFSKDLEQRGFSFVGSTVVYAHMACDTAAFNF